MTGSGANVTVTGVLMTVDSHCSVAISSLSQPECSPPSNTEPRTNSTSTATTKSDADRSGSDSTTIAIISGVVAILLFIFVAIVIIINDNVYVKHIPCPIAISRTLSMYLDSRTFIVKRREISGVAGEHSPLDQCYKPSQGRQRRKTDV